MESIIIHPNNKKQTRVFANMAKALNIDFQIKNESSEREFSEEDFLKRFQAGSSIEESRESTLRYVRSLWTK